MKKIIHALAFLAIAVGLGSALAQPYNYDYAPSPILGDLKALGVPRFDSMNQNLRTPQGQSIPIGVGTANGILQGNGTGTVTAVTVGSGLTFSGGTLSASGGSAGGSNTQIQYNSSGAFAGDSGLTYNSTNKALSIGGATVTSSTPALNVAQTVNNGSTVFTVGSMNVTNTASSLASKFMDYQISGTSAMAIGFPAVNNNVYVGSVNGAGLTLTNGADTLQISADNQYHSSIIANNQLVLFTGSALRSGIGINGIYTAPSMDASGYDGMTLDRRSIWWGRHASQRTGDPVTDMGPISIGVTPLLDDEPPAVVQLMGQAQWSQAVNHTAGGNILLAGGPGRKFYTFVTPNSTGGKTVTITINGTAVTLTEGTSFNCNTLTTTQCATNLASAINGNTTLNTRVTATASSANVFLDWNRSWSTGPLYSIQIATNAGAAITTTSGMDGTVQVTSGVQLSPSPQPTCAAAYAGTFWYTAGGAGVKDSVAVCAKDATDAYAWRTIY